MRKGVGLSAVLAGDESDKTSEDDDGTGIWREITGADNDPKRKIVTILLACGHKVKMRTDTPLGNSFLQTVWKAAKCHQCDGTEMWQAS
jgi:hypothetical protein